MSARRAVHSSKVRLRALSSVSSDQPGLPPVNLRRHFCSCWHDEILGERNRAKHGCISIRSIQTYAVGAPAVYTAAQRTQRHAFGSASSDRTGQETRVALVVCSLFFATNCKKQLPSALFQVFALLLRITPRESLPWSRSQRTTPLFIAPTRGLSRKKG